MATLVDLRRISQLSLFSFHGAALSSFLQMSNRLSRIYPVIFWILLNPCKMEMTPILVTFKSSIKN